MVFMLVLVNDEAIRLANQLIGQSAYEFTRYFLNIDKQAVSAEVILASA